MSGDNKQVSGQTSSLSLAAIATQSIEIQSFLASPIKNSLKSNVLYTPKRSTLQARNHDSIVSGNQSATFARGGDQAFSIIEDRLLPSFTGPGFKGTVEEMNQLTRQWVASTRFDVLMTELYTLLKSGMISLTAKLAPTPDEFLTSKAAEIWTNFYGSIVPNIQAALLPLRQLKRQDPTFDLRNQILCSFKSFVIWPMKGRLQEILSTEISNSNTNVTDVVPKLTQMLVTLSALKDPQRIDQNLAMASLLKTLRSSNPILKPS